MDPTNPSALAHAQNIVIQALLSTHPNPKDLSSSLTHYLYETSLTLGTNDKLLGAVKVWVDTFRLHLPSVEPNPLG